MRCPSYEELFDLIRAKLAGERGAALTAHVEGCPRCRAASDWLARVLAASQQGPLPEPPQAVLERAFDVMPRKAAATESAPRRWSLAELVRETFGQALPAGIRGAATAERRLLYAAGDAELDLEIARGDVGKPAYRIAGQLLMRGDIEELEIIAVLWSDGVAVARGVGDAMGMFMLRDIPPGSYRLEVWIPAAGHIIRMDPLQVGTERQDRAPEPV
ncbi:MAG TPA: hypothetical protein VIC59_12220 [Gemmatimonadota bacterium]|jgi:hypothetical protein